MEATKKKKAYLKPEMSRFEVKTQEFIAGSKYVEEIIDISGLLGNNCTTGGLNYEGAGSTGAAANELPPGACATYNANGAGDEMNEAHQKCNLFQKMKQAGFPIRDESIVKICHPKLDVWTAQVIKY